MSIFVDALKCNNKSGQIPVWFMRQAGRYLPEYQELRKQYDFRTTSHTPALMKEITIQPLKRYPLDAAVIFSDILTCLEYMGAPFSFTNEGPKLTGAGFEAFTQLKPFSPESDMPFIREGIQLIAQDIPNTPLIGFVGAPFTLASYLIEGGTSREFIQTRRSMLEMMSEFKEGLNLLADELSKYAIFQIDSGVSAIQIFDSWAGILSLDVYDEIIKPSVDKLIQNIRTKRPDIPIILYTQPTSHLFESLMELSPNVISVDWREPISKFALKLKKSRPDIGIQGNLDPIATTLSWKKCKPFVESIISQIKECNFQDRYVFNVGHGVTPWTKTETIDEIVKYVKGSL